MQLIPFVFTIIFVFMALITRLNKEESLDTAYLQELSEIQNTHLILLKNAERSFFIKKRQLSKVKQKDEKMGQQNPTKVIDTRQLGSSMSASKFSMAVFTKPLDEITKQKAIKLIDRVLSDIYGTMYHPSILNALLEAAKNNHVKHVSQLDLKNNKLQKAYFKMLTYELCPLDHLITFEPLESKALFHFFYLRKDLFQKAFSKLSHTDFFTKEVELQKKFRSHIVPRDQIKQLLLNLDDSFSQVALDQLVSFKSPENQNLKPSSSKNFQQYFYLPRD